MGKNPSASTHFFIFIAMHSYRSFYNDSINEEYPGSWNKEEFEKIQSFSGKLRYANERLQKLASGSGRAVFKIDEQKVLKVAKNKKGLAQNAVEAEPFLQSYDAVAKTFDSDDRYVQEIGPFWVEMELAKKVGKSRFKQLTGVPIEMAHGYFVEYMGRGQQWPKISPEDAEKLHDNQFIVDMMSLIGDYDMSIGDLGRVSTYGEVTRDGEQKIVLVDFGLTNQVYNDYYKVRM